ncbi:ankyrin, partial [Piromyces finnis]
MSILKRSSFSLDDKICMLKQLLKKGYNFKNIDATKNSPLIYAIQTGCLPLIQFLIENGIDINYTDENGKSPLIYAIQKKSMSIVTLLIKFGANINIMKNYERNPN